MENTQQTISIENILDSCSKIRIYFIEKQPRNAGYKVYLFPNDATNDALADYKTNFKNYVSNRDIVDYSQTEVKKETIQKLPIVDLPQWAEIKTAIDNMPITSAPILKPSDVSKKIIMTVVECLDDEDNSYAYLITKFAYNSTYKNKVRFCFVMDTYEKIKAPVLTLGDCIDCFIYNDDVYILLESRFDSLFDFHKRIKDEVSSKIDEINEWDFFDNNDISEEIINKPRKSRQFLKVIDSASLSKWKTMTAVERKELIQGDEKLKDKFQFDDENRIIRTKESISELFKLLTSDYYMNILTGKTEER
jgi:hypothetical protein